MSDSVEEFDEKPQQPEESSNVFKLPAMLGVKSNKKGGETKESSSQVKKEAKQFPSCNQIKVPASVYKPFQPLLPPDKSSLSFKMKGQKLDTKEKVVEKMEDVAEKKSVKQKPQKVAASPVRCDYKTPKWSKVVEKPYSLEVLKEGSIVGQLSLTDQENFMFGRLKTCDFMLEHPSISRFHAVLQYGSPTEDEEQVRLQKDGTSGWYLHDMGSTHLTYINKQPIKPRLFYRVKVGHMIKFGGSSRIYILQGPAEDEEDESEETATELREKARDRKKEKERLDRMMMGEDDDDEDRCTNKEEKNDDNGSSEGVTWGMLEDAVNDEDSEDEEVGNDEADSKGDADLLARHNQQDRFYNKDPHKAIKHFFEKEGVEINFECVERRSGQWSARLELPVLTKKSGKCVWAEAVCSGRRVQAVNMCALEACRILDRHGMFDEKRRKVEKLKKFDEDYYESDEDGYLDRTGDLEVKRMRRRKRDGKTDAGDDKPQNYQSLVEKIKNHENEISDIEAKLEKDRKMTKVEANNEDSLQSFMRMIRSGEALDSTSRSKLKMRLINVRKELLHLHKLAQVARPVHLPPLKTSVVEPMSFMARLMEKRKQQQIKNNKSKDANSTASNVTKCGGKDKGDDVVEQGDDVVEEDDVVKQDGNNNEVKSVEGCGESENEVDVKQANDDTSQNDAVPHEGGDQCKSEDSTIITSVKHQQSHPAAEEQADCENNTPDTSCLVEPLTSNVRVMGPTLPLHLKRKLDSSSAAQVDEPQESSKNENEDVSVKKRKRNRKKVKKPKVETTRMEQNEADDDKYAGWMPPQGQTGDGKTSLNEKYGY